MYGVHALSGQLLVSEDLTNWEARSSQPLIDIAVNPMDPDDYGRWFGSHYGGKFGSHQYRYWLMLW